MIPRDYITEWRVEAPWVQDSQVEQDLVISRALVEIFSHPLLSKSLALVGVARKGLKKRETQMRIIGCDRHKPIPGSTVPWSSVCLLDPQS